MAGREVLVQCVSARCYPLVEMERLNLQRDTALYVLEAEVSGRGMARLDDVEEVGVGVGVEDRKVGRLAPCVDEVEVEVDGRVTFDCGEWRRMR